MANFVALEADMITLKEMESITSGVPYSVRKSFLRAFKAWITLQKRR